MQDSVLTFGELHEITVWQLLQPVEDPLNGSSCCINHSSNLFVTCRLANLPPAHVMLGTMP